MKYVTKMLLENLADLLCKHLVGKMAHSLCL